VKDEEFILHQIPSGILHPDKRCLLGNGVVLDPLQFFKEYDDLRVIPIGVYRAGRTMVNPQGDFVIKEDDRLLYIADERQDLVRVLPTL
jgi:adenylosuccinate synthase